MYYQSNELNMWALKDLNYDRFTDYNIFDYLRIYTIYKWFKAIIVKYMFILTRQFYKILYPIPHILFPSFILQKRVNFILFSSIFCRKTKNKMRRVCKGWGERGKCKRRRKKEFSDIHYFFIDNFKCILLHLF